MTKVPARRITTPPESLTMYWCNGCGTFRTTNPMNHFDRYTGKACAGEIRHITYGRTYGAKLVDAAVDAMFPPVAPKDSTHECCERCGEAKGSLMCECPQMIY